jgi:hypothetical protein
MNQSKRALAAMDGARAISATAAIQPVDFGLGMADEIQQGIEL